MGDNWLVDIPTNKYSTSDQPSEQTGDTQDNKPGPTKKTTHSLWRFFNKERTLLYISQKPNPAVMQKFNWWPDVAYIRVTHFDSLDAIAEAKLLAIYNEDPLWNAHGRKTNVDA